MKKSITETELAAIIVNDAANMIADDWRVFKENYEILDSLDDLTGQREVIAARLGSAIIVLRNVVQDIAKAVRIIDIMRDQVQSHLERELKINGIWGRTIEYVEIMDAKSVKGRDEEMMKLLTKIPKDDPFFPVVFQGDMVELVTKFVNVKHYCEQFKIK